MQIEGVGQAGRSLGWELVSEGEGEKEAST